MDTFVRIIAKIEENKGVELTGGGTTAEELRNRKTESSGERGLLVIEGVEGTDFESEGTSDVQDVKRAGAQKRGVSSSDLLRQLVSGGGKGDDLHNALLDIFAEQTVDFRCFGGQQFFSEQPQRDGGEDLDFPRIGKEQRQDRPPLLCRGHDGIHIRK